MRKTISGALAKLWRWIRKYKGKISFGLLSILTSIGIGVESTIGIKNALKKGVDHISSSLETLSKEMAKKVEELKYLYQQILLNIQFPSLVF